jgi:hypothetical protein
MVDLELKEMKTLLWPVQGPSLELCGMMPAMTEVFQKLMIWC